MRNARTWAIVIAAAALAAATATFAPSDWVSRTAELLEDGKTNPEIGDQNSATGPQIIGQAQAQPRPKATPGTSPATPTPAESAKPSSSQRSETVVHDSWTTTCHDQGDPNTRACTTTLQIVEKTKRQVLFAWVIGLTQNRTLTSFFQTPTGVQIQKGVDIKLGDFDVRNAPYVICVAQRCEAALKMEKPVIDEAMKSLDGKTVATITLVDGRTVNFTMPLKGLDQALAMIRK